MRAFRLIILVAATLSLFFGRPASASIPSNFIPSAPWYRNCASLDLDFYNDQYYINHNTTCDGTIGTTYTAGSGNTGVQNFITGAGATFTRAGTNNVTDTNPPFYLDATQGQSFVSRASSGTYFDNTGTLQTASTNTARSSTYSYNGSAWVANSGTLIEPAATNSIRNNTMVGAVAADGVERTTNGTFATSCSGSTCSGWTATTAGSATVSFATGTANLTGDGTNAASIYQKITTVSGYIYTIAVTTGAGNAVTMQAGTTAGGAQLLSASAANAGIATSYQFVAAGTSSYVQINNTSATAAAVTTVSVLSAGALPTNWVYEGGSGLLESVVGTGTEDGINYVDINFSGTTTALFNIGIQFNVNDTVSASIGQTWSGSAYVKLSGGSWGTYSVAPRLTLSERNLGTIIVSSSTTLSPIPTGAALPTQGFTVTRTLTSTSANNVTLNVGLQYTSGQAVNFTARIGMPQLEQSSYTTSVIATSSAAITRAADVYSVPSGGTYFNSSGVMKTAPVNTPRLDHSPVSPYAAEGVLIEESRTNELLNSQNFSGYGNNGTGATTTANATTSPDGTTDATLLSTSTSNVTQFIYSAFANGAASTTYTASVFAKAVTGSAYHQVMIALGNSAFGTAGAGNQYYAMAGELNNCTVVNGSAGLDTSVAYTAQSVGNGWCRFSVSGTSLASPGVNYVAAINVYNSGTYVFTGNGNGIYIYGADVEVGNFPTSYIPTSGSTVTRARDALTLPTTAGGGWYTQGVGTLLANAIIPFEIGSGTSDVGESFAGMDDGTSSNSLSLKVSDSNSYEGNAGIVVSGSFTYSKFTVSGLSNNTIIKGALSYNGTNAYSAFNGVSLASASASAPSSLTELDIGMTPLSGVYTLNGWLQRVTYFPIMHPSASLPQFTQ
jgi:hypothetical protein